MSALEVRLGSARVGLLERISEWTYCFSFDPSWVRQLERPVLGQFFEDVVPRDIETFGNVPCWFDHLLPPPNGPLRRSIAHQAGIDSDDEFELLALLGEDLPGAVVLVPGQPRLSRGPGDAIVPAAEPPKGALSSSLAGQQLKLSVRVDDQRLTLCAGARSSSGGDIRGASPADSCAF
jgi:serine/threonine-protein kinase HipA